MGYPLTSTAAIDSSTSAGAGSLTTGSVGGASASKIAAILPLNVAPILAMAILLISWKLASAFAKGVLLVYNIHGGLGLGYHILS